MNDTTDSTTGATGCDPFADDGRDETLLMHKGTELEAVSTTGVNLTDPEYTMQIGDTTEQMNRFFRCHYDSSMLSKFPESLKIAYIDSEYVSDRDTVFGKCRNEETCNHVAYKIVEFPAEQMDHFLRKRECQRVPSKFPESLNIAYTDLECVSDRERAIDTEMLKNQARCGAGRIWRVGPVQVLRCRASLPHAREDKRELMTPTSTFYIITLNLMKKTKNNAIDESGTCWSQGSAQNVSVKKKQTSVGKRPSRLS